jgi:uncharacterized integral membrane protein
MRTAKRIFYGLLFFIFLLFLFQNYSTLTSSHSLRLNLGFLLLESVALPFYLIVVLSFFAGLFIAFVIAFFERRPMKRELKELRNRNRELEKPGSPQPSKPDPFKPAGVINGPPPQERGPLS